MEKLDAIEIDDGVNQMEAVVLAQEYFLAYVSGCGVTHEPVDRGDYWAVHAAVGYTATPPPNPITINKRSARLTLEGYPTIEYPVEHFKRQLESGYQAPAKKDTKPEPSTESNGTP